MGAWTCSACTFQNRSGDQCSVCGHPKPLVGDEWRCAGCTLNNAAAATKCVVCDMPRPKAGKRARQEDADAPARHERHLPTHLRRMSTAERIEAVKAASTFSDEPEEVAPPPPPLLKVAVPQWLRGGMTMEVDCGPPFGLCTVPIPAGLVPGQSFCFNPPITVGGRVLRHRPPHAR